VYLYGYSTLTAWLWLTSFSLSDHVRSLFTNYRLLSCQHCDAWAIFITEYSFRLIGRHRFQQCCREGACVVRTTWLLNMHVALSSVQSKISPPGCQPVTAVTALPVHGSGASCRGTIHYVYFNIYNCEMAEDSNYDRKNVDSKYEGNRVIFLWY